MVEDLIWQDVARILSHTPTLAQLRGKRLLLTGGTGFIGMWLLHVLASLNEQLDSPCHVFLLTRNRDSFIVKFPQFAHRSDVTFLLGDVCTFDFPDVPCDFVIHAAAPADRNIVNSDPSQVLQTIISGTENVLKFAVWRSVTRFLYLSSGAIYGPQPADCAKIPETYAGAPDISSAASSYGEAKRLAEVLCAIYREKQGVPVCIVRPFSFMGPYQNLDAGFAVTDFIRDGLSGQPLRINSDGSAIRSYCYGADLARYLLAILLEGKIGTAYNVGSEEPITILELAKKIAIIMQQHNIFTTIQLAKTSAQEKPPNRYIPDVGRLRSELGLQPLFTFDEALSNTVRWFVRSKKELPVENN